MPEVKLYPELDFAPFRVFALKYISPNPANLTEYSSFCPKESTLFLKLYVMLFTILYSHILLLSFFPSV